MKRRRKAEAILRQAREARLIDAWHYYQLTGCVVQYTSINIILWTIFSIFAAAHALLVNALIGILEREDHAFARVAVSLVGVLAAFAWAALLRRTIGHLLWYQALVTRIEDDPELRINEAHQMFPARVAAPNPDHDVRPLPKWRYCAPATLDHDASPAWGYGPPAKAVMQGCTWVTVGLWLITFAYFLFTAAWPLVRAKLAAWLT
jgi:hypothetical protein